MSKSAAIGIDLGGTNCRGALVTQNGEVLGWRRFESDPASGLERFLQRLTGFCRELSAAAAEKGLTVIGVGCGAAGVIAPSGRILSSPNLPMLDQFDLQAYLQQQLKMPALVINDANAIAWGEACRGSGRDFESFLTMTLGTGVGGGLVLQRRLWHGVCGGAGEIGHLAVEAKGRSCGCGSHGCLEQYASGQGILQNYQGLIGLDTEVTIDSIAIAELARRGDPVALSAFEMAGRYLGQAIAGVVNLLNLEAVIFGGGLSNSLELLQPALKQELVQRAFAVNHRCLQLLQAQRGEEAGILGVADLVFDQLNQR